MAIKSIVEMQAKPGRRDDLLSTLQQGDSNEERLAWSQSLDPGTREQLTELLAAPMRVIRAEHIE